MTPNPRTFTPCSRQFAADRTEALLGCYRKGDAEDPVAYTKAVVTVLAAYPEDVVRWVTHPNFGLPGKVQWLPTVAEVKAACEAQMAPRYELARQQRAAQDRARMLTPPVVTQEQRDRAIEHWEREVRPKLSPNKVVFSPTLAADKLKQMANLTDAQWDAIPNAPLRNWKTVG
jgi:hypothetical protein